MARKARPGLGTVIKFIALDDEAIGGDLDTLGSRYSEYIRTANHLVLEIDPAKDPAFYFMRPLTTRQVQKMQRILIQTRTLMGKRIQQLKDLEGDQTITPVSDTERKMEDDLESDYIVVRKEILDECFIGCVEHKMVTKVLDDGELEYTEIKWDIGTKRPEGLLDDVVGDNVLVDNMIHYLLNASRLTEKEKKR